MASDTSPFLAVYSAVQKSAAVWAAAGVWASAVAPASRLVARAAPAAIITSRRPIERSEFIASSRSVRPHRSAAVPDDASRLNLTRGAGSEAFSPPYRTGGPMRRDFGS